MKVGAKATVRVTLEIESDGSWADDCTVGQIHTQAAEAAIGKLHAMIAKSGMRGIRLLSKPVVSAVVTDPEAAK